MAFPSIASKRASQWRTRSSATSLMRLSAPTTASRAANLVLSFSLWATSAENDVLVFGGIEVATQFVGGCPKRRFEAEVTPIYRVFYFFRFAAFVHRFSVGYGSSFSERRLMKKV